MTDRDVSKGMRSDDSRAQRSSPAGRISAKLAAASRGSAIISRDRLVALAALAAWVQNVRLRHARAPKAVTTAIRELNAIARLAGNVLGGSKDAEKALRDELARPVRGFLGPLFASATAPAGAASGSADGAGSGAAPSGQGALPGGGPGASAGAARRCDEVLSGARDVLQAGFQLDVRDGARKPVHTTHATTYRKRPPLPPVTAPRFCRHS
ncbi:hypothetical protein [Aromatoleum aromaticum]|uniref:hypothetical protein n=1 Tax=Aromatoleum aromaticum TaxID=551760 RepID=UPI0002DED8B3|nr:hypothetical protein [Aromatoleum aromaticum]